MTSEPLESAATRSAKWLTGGWAVICDDVLAIRSTTGFAVPAGSLSPVPPPHAVSASVAAAASPRVLASGDMAWPSFVREGARDIRGSTDGALQLVGCTSEHGRARRVCLPC